MRWFLALGLATLAAPVHAQPSERNLEQCIAIALEQHPSLRAAGASVDAAHQRVWQAASGYLPRVNGTFLAQRSKTSLSANTNTDVDTQSATFNFYSGGFRFSQVLFDFGQVLTSIRAAQESQRSVEADRVTQEQTVVFNVKQSYFNVLAAQRLLGVADETVHQVQKQLEQAEARYGTGLAPRLDVTRAKVQLANAELNQLTARNAVAVSRETLRNALGQSSPLDFDIVDILEAPRAQVSEADALAAAYANRPDLQSIEAQERALEQDISGLKRDYLPFVTADGNYLWSGSDTPLQDNWRIGAAVNLSLFNGGLTTAQIGEAQANLARLHFDEESLRQNIALDVRRSTLDLQQAAERIGVAAKGADEARENLELAEGRYNTGVGNIIELTDAQAASTSADADYVRALYDYHISLAALERAMAKPVRDEAS